MRIAGYDARALEIEHNRGEAEIVPRSGANGSSAALSCVARPTAERRDELTPFKVEHGDFLPDALSAPPTVPCQSSAASACHYETGKFLGHQADLRGAYLREANLIHAYLALANLSEANLREADLSTEALPVDRG
jgi:hypothetical protein